MNYKANDQVNGQANDEANGQAYRAFEHAAWERAAAHYSDTFASATRLFADGLLDAVTCGPGQRILDIACGPGPVSSLATMRGAQVTGIDFSAAMVAEARRRNPGISFEQADAESLPFADGSFDAVVCGFGVHHFASPVRALAEARRVLRPGGQFAFTVWASDEHVPQQLLVSTVRAHGTGVISLPTPPHGDINSPEACARLLIESGFAQKSVRVSKLRSVLKVGSMAEVIAMLLKGTARSSALLQAQPADAMAAIHAGFERAAEQYKCGQGYELPAAAVLALAGKA